MTSKLSEISAEMDEQNVPMEDKNSLIGRVSAGMHAAERTIDTANKSKKHGEPSVISDEAIALAEKVKEFAMRTHNVVTVDGKNYAKVGVYQYLAAELGITPTFRFDDESTEKEVWCSCSLRNEDGEEITRTTMYADKTEGFLRDKPDYAVIGMAQTRAFGRAMKNLYGYIVELAGLQSIALEEVVL